MPLNGFERATHSRILRGQEADQRNEQSTRVEVLRSVALHEGSEFGVKAVAADIIMNSLAQLAPSIEWTIELEMFDGLDGAVECDPRHHLGVDEVLPVAAHFPYAVIGILPNTFEMAQHLQLEFPALLVVAKRATAAW